MVCTTLKARGVKEASVLNLGSLHADLAKPSSQTGWTSYPDANAVMRQWAPGLQYAHQMCWDLHVWQAPGELEHAPAKLWSL